MFKEKLIELRKQNSHTQESMAKQLHVSRSLIAKWEQGRAYPTLDDLNNILKLYNLEFDDLMTKEELKNIYGIVSKKEKNKKKIILSLTLIISVLLVSISILPFCSITNVPQATKISAKYSMKYGYNNIVLEDGSMIELNEESPLFINGESVKYQPDTICYDSFNECKITYNLYKKINGYNIIIDEFLEIDSIELIEPISNNTLGFYIDFEAIGLNNNPDYEKDSVLYYYFDKETHDVISNYSFNQKLLHKENTEIGISYYEYLFEMNLDFDNVKEYYLRNNPDIGHARIPIYFILSNGEISSLPTHNYLKKRKATHIELSWGSGIGYGISDGDFKMMVCNVDSKFINPSSDNLYQNVLFKFKINMN